MADHTVYSLNCSLRWKAASGSVWAGETWQTHLRLLVEDTALDLSSGRVDPVEFGVSDASVVRQEDIWDIDAAWVGRGAVLGDRVVTDADINAILDAFKTYIQSTAAYFNTQYVFDSVRIYPMLKGGGTPFKAGVSATGPIIATPTGTQLNPSGAGSMPPDAAIAVSLGTGTRGPSGRGRMFLGGLATTALGSDGRIAASYVTEFGNSAEQLLEDLRAIETGGPTGCRFTPVIYTSRPNKSGANADTASVINTVRMSDEWDTQRRRDRQRADVYTALPLEA